MKSVLFTFPDTHARAKFLEIMNSLFSGRQGALTFISSSMSLEDMKLLSDAVASAVDGPDISTQHRHCSVWVSGKKLAEGEYSQMTERFAQECEIHSANVVLKELKNTPCGKCDWLEIRSRRIQH
jgi:hypothetical protein